jgi:hypothetical protein
VGDDVIDQDGERCRVVSVDTEDFEKPYELEYPNGSKFWAAESALTAATDSTVRPTAQPRVPAEGALAHGRPRPMARVAMQAGGGKPVKPVKIDPIIGFLKTTCGCVRQTPSSPYVACLALGSDLDAAGLTRSGLAPLLTATQRLGSVQRRPHPELGP